MLQIYLPQSLPYGTVPPIMTRLNDPFVEKSLIRVLSGQRLPA